MSFCICLFIRKCAKFVSVRACLYDGLFIGSFPLSSRGMARIFIVIAWYGNEIVLRYSVGCDLNKIQTLTFWLKCSHFGKSKLEMSELSNHTDMPNNTQTQSFARIRNKHTTAKWSILFNCNHIVRCWARCFRYFHYYCCCCYFLAYCQMLFHWRAMTDTLSSINWNCCPALLCYLKLIYFWFIFQLVFFR